MWGRKGRLIGDLQGVIANYARAEARLMDKIGDRDRAIGRIQGMLDHTKKENEGWLADLKSMQKRIVQLESERAELEQKVARAESSADAAIQAGGLISDELHAAQEDITRKEATIKALTSELQRVKREQGAYDHDTVMLDSAFRKMGTALPFKPTRTVELPDVVQSAPHGFSGPCCDLHRPADGKDPSPCCDPEDCGPCCERCPTCPTLKRMKDAPDPTGGWTKGPQEYPPSLSL